MSHNPEILSVFAFAAALLLGLAGAPLWLAIFLGGVYGMDAVLTTSQNATDRRAGDHVWAKMRSGEFAVRIGRIVLAYAFALGLRFLGST